MSFVMIMSFTGCFGSGTNQEDLDTEDKGKDGISLKGEVKTSTLAEASIGDLIKFGKYEQDTNEEKKEDIEWLVLDKKDGKILVISRYGLDSVKFLDKTEKASDEKVTWETSTLRTWLNTTFMSEAFTDEEKNKISETNIVAEDNEKYSVNAGSHTVDKMFLLSLPEADKYFKADGETASNNARKCRATAYAKKNGTWTVGAKNNFLSYWSLRTPGYDNNFVAYVDSDGRIHDAGLSFAYTHCSVRPAMWISIGE